MSNQRIILIGIITVLSIAVVVALVASGLYLQGEQGRAVQTLQGALASQTVPPTVAPSATLIESTPTPAALDLSNSVQLFVEDTGAPLINDGESRRAITVTVLRDVVAGQEIIFTASGGGRVEPDRMQLPALNESVTVEYITGDSVGTVRIDGTVTIGRNSTVSSTQLNLVSEVVNFSVEYLPPQTDGLVPITYRIMSGTSEPMQGTYALRLQAAQGTRILSAEGVEIDRITLSATTPEVTVRVAKPIAQDTVVVTASVLGRPDIEALRTPLAWGNPVDSFRLTNVGDDERYLWYALEQYSICSQSIVAGVGLSLPSMLQVSYRPLLVQDPQEVRFLLDGASIEPNKIVELDPDFLPDEWVRTGESVICLQPSFARIERGGLIDIEVAPTYRIFGDNALALIHYGRVWQAPTATQLSFLDGTRDVASIPLRNGLVPEMFMIEARNQSLVIARLYLQGKAIDVESQRAIIPSDTSQAMMDYNIQAAWIPPVPLTFTDTSFPIYMPDVPLNRQLDAETYYEVYAMGILR